MEIKERRAGLPWWLPRLGALGSIPCGGSRSHRQQPRVHTPQLKIPQATEKIRDPECSQINIFLKNLFEFSLFGTMNAGVSRHGVGGGAGLWGGGSRQAQVLVLPLHCCVAAGKSLSFSGPRPRAPLPPGRRPQRELPKRGDRDTGTRRARSPRCHWGGRQALAGAGAETEVRGRPSPPRWGTL